MQKLTTSLQHMTDTFVCELLVACCFLLQCKHPDDYCTSWVESYVKTCSNWVNNKAATSSEIRNNMLVQLHMMQMITHHARLPFAACTKIVHVAYTMHVWAKVIDIFGKHKFPA